MSKRKRIPKIKSSVLISPAQERKKLPKELIDAYLNLHKTKIKDVIFDVECYGWEENAYEKYKEEAKKLIGNMADDPIEGGKLIVRLARATKDLRYGKKKEEESKTVDSGSGMVQEFSGANEEQEERQKETPSMETEKE